MLTSAEAFNGFAVDDLEKAKEFYGEKLGLKVEAEDVGPGILSIDLPGTGTTMVYGKPDNQPANHTIVNFRVDDIEAEVDELTSRGIAFERYEGFDQDDKGIARGDGPNIAWFKDPAGNILSVLEES